MLESYLTGLIVCGGIIVAIGAQNAYVLGQAVRREHHWWVAGLCMSSDILLFSAGMFGMSALLLTYPVALDVLRWLGVGFLLWLAVVATWRAVLGRVQLKSGQSGGSRLRSVVATTLAVTLLNPQVYLDTLLLVPAVGAQQSEPFGFLAGASSASVLWFGLLAWSGAMLAPILARPLAWRIIDGVIATMMAAIALHLVVNGIQLAVV
ncbi:LysE/ArgO family amino acid transporter [Marinobacter sp. SS21]|uniref:LysE/ArgO family amino acid transporter n=1 Tax=Marinobacter sp. SS21 TaxID=2979460 RepID=UPI00232BC6A7|nr:LysE/ArgO family amino acid transporter [Marinobacter sp. SS21]MDC0661613.1 LysE/ArgO family amino acid transporter [Marinobacter sp. SS21]